MFEQADALIVGAEWRDPAAATHWDEQVPVDRDVIVHCIYGHEVGRANRALEPKPAGVQ